MEFARSQVLIGHFSINRVCQLTGISKATYYDAKHPDDKFEAKYEHLKAKISKVIHDNSAYGVKRIKSALWEDYHLHIGRDALARLLRLWGLQLKRKTKKSKSSIIQKILIFLAGRANLLIRTKLTAPFQAITSDISEIFYDHGKRKAYLAAHKDVFGQAVYGWQLAENMDTGLVISSFEQAEKNIKKLLGRIPGKMLCHSDQGSQYTSYEYVDRVIKHNLRLSYSTPGTPTENPGQESFFGRLKEERQDEISEVSDFKELQRFLRGKIHYYNRRRLHTSLGNQAPLKFTKQFIKNLSLIESKKWYSIFRD